MEKEKAKTCSSTTGKCLQFLGAAIMLHVIWMLHKIQNAVERTGQESFFSLSNASLFNGKTLLLNGKEEQTYINTYFFTNYSRKLNGTAGNY